MRRFGWSTKPFARICTRICNSAATGGGCIGASGLRIVDGTLIWNPVSLQKTGRSKVACHQPLDLEQAGVRRMVARLFAAVSLPLDLDFPRFNTSRSSRPA